MLSSSTIIRPFFGQDCTKRWRMVDRLPSDDIGRNREAPMNSAPTPKETEPHDAVGARADERLANAHEQIKRADEQLSRLTEQLEKMERDAAHPPSARPG